MRVLHSLAAIALAAALAACAVQYRLPAEPPRPVAPQPAAGDLRPGLVPLYFRGMIEHIDNMPRGEDLAKGRRGAAIPVLDADSSSGVMWESQDRRNYSVLMEGLIRLDRPGRWGFAASSNDGIRITIDRHRVVDDPNVHATQTSPVTFIEVAQAGWYPLQVQYFQKGGSAALKFLWQPPGAGTLAPVPAEALAHKP